MEPPEIREISFIPWEGLNRGEISANGIVTRKCSVDYLACICATTEIAFRGMLEGLVAGRYGSTAFALLHAVGQEHTRLQNNTALFPSHELGSRFFTAQNYSFQKCFEARQKIQHRPEREALLHQANMLIKEESELLETLNRPMFQPELLPWEQFLLKGSPGCNVKFPDVPPNGIVQVMPIGGVALHLRWLRTRYLMGKKCGEANPPVPIFEGHEVEVSAAAGCLPSSGMEYSRFWFDITPNFYFEHYYPMTKDRKVSDNLESFTSLIEILEDGEFTNYCDEPTGVKAMYYISMKRSRASGGNEV